MRKIFLTIIFIISIISGYADDKTVITYISNWKHPVKEVFKEYNLKLTKVELVNNNVYPIFYLNDFAEVFCDKKKKSVKKSVNNSSTLEFEKFTLTMEEAVKLIENKLGKF